MLCSRLDLRRLADCWRHQVMAETTFEKPSAQKAFIFDVAFEAAKLYCPITPNIVAVPIQLVNAHATLAVS